MYKEEVMYCYKVMVGCFANNHNWEGSSSNLILITQCQVYMMNCVLKKNLPPGGAVIEVVKKLREAKQSKSDQC